MCMVNLCHGAVACLSFGSELLYRVINVRLDVKSSLI